jgi:hypothetical protein
VVCIEFVVSVISCMMRLDLQTKMEVRRVDEEEFVLAAV